MVNWQPPELEFRFLQGTCRSSSEEMLSLHIALRMTARNSYNCWIDELSMLQRACFPPSSATRQRRGTNAKIDGFITIWLFHFLFPILLEWQNKSFAEWQFSWSAIINSTGSLGSEWICIRIFSPHWFASKKPKCDIRSLNPDYDLVPLFVHFFMIRERRTRSQSGYNRGTRSRQISYGLQEIYSESLFKMIKRTNRIFKLTVLLKKARRSEVESFHWLTRFLSLSHRWMIE